MSKQDESQRAFLLGLLSQEDEAAVLSALELLRRFTDRCTAILVDDQASPPDDGPVMRSRFSARQRIQSLKAKALNIGMSIDVEVKEMQESVERMRRCSQQDMIVLCQPAYALDRQTLAFRRIEMVLRDLPTPVLYAPSKTNARNVDVIEFKANKDSSTTLFARSFAGSDGQITHINAEGFGEVARPESDLRLRIQTRDPSLIIVDSKSLSEAEPAYSRLAAVLGIPLLVVTEGQE